VPEELRYPTALSSSNYYDQIALRTQNKLFEIQKAGCFGWQKYVFRDDDHAQYRSFMPAATRGGKAAKTDAAAYRKWRTWQMSDHLPLWAEVKMDFTDSYLESLRSGSRPLASFDIPRGRRRRATVSSGHDGEPDE
jgi:hypothetical protein